MAKIDAAVAESKVGHDHYAKYSKQREVTEAGLKGLEFKLGRLTVSFKCDWERVRVFVGPTELTREEAITLAEGLLERLK